MTHDLPVEWLNAFLDKELSPVERETARVLLSADLPAQEQLHGLQDLDHRLRRLLVAPDFSAETFLAMLDERRHSTALTRTAGSGGFGDATSALHRKSRRIPIATVATAVALLSVIAIMILVPRFSGFSPSSSPHASNRSVAQVVRTIGIVEYQIPQSPAWRQVRPGIAMPVIAGTRIRTPRSSLCEIETADQGILRMNHETELVVHKAEIIELVSGELWCSTAAGPALRILIPERGPRVTPDAAPQPVLVFVCPPDTATQWAVTELETKCFGVSDTVAELALPGSQSCAVEPGQVLSMRNNSVPVVTGWEDRLLAMGWQLPLLAIRRPDDPELQSRLQSLLARIGQTKMSSMYDSQIRSLGPAGTIPLIAFVRSPQSLANPDLRYQAMQIIADLAPASTRSDLEVLAMDADTKVSQLASAALLRLKS